MLPWDTPNESVSLNAGESNVSWKRGLADGESRRKSQPPIPADHLAKVSLELGAKSPNIVISDADLEATNNGVVSGIFAATGQTCIAGSWLFVQEKAHDELVERLSDRAGTIKLGSPLADETEMGPVAFKEQLDNEVARDEGELVSGGRRPDTEELRDGYFIDLRSSRRYATICG